MEHEGAFTQLSKIYDNTPEAKEHKGWTFTLTKFEGNYYCTIDYIDTKPIYNKSNEA